MSRARASTRCSARRRVSWRKTRMLPVMVKRSGAKFSGVPAWMEHTAHTRQSVGSVLRPVSYTHLDVYKRQSLGCDKNRVNTEQMMALCQAAGHEVTGEPDGADVAVVNTCGFIDSAKEEAIATILEVAPLKELSLIHI